MYLSRLSRGQEKFREACISAGFKMLWLWGSR